MYIVRTLKEAIKVEVIGIERSLPLFWADGMVGAVPVFKDKEQALKYANGNGSLLIEIKYQ